MSGSTTLGITVIRGIVLGTGIPGIVGIVPGSGMARFTIVPGPGTLGIRGIVPIGMARVFTGIPGIGTAGTATARVSIMVPPAVIIGPEGAGITPLMPVATAPVAVLSVRMSAA